MRLTTLQIETILGTVRAQTGPGARVILFGSRVNDEARGGDVDLLVEDDAPLSLLQRAAMKSELEAALSLPVDIVPLRRGAKVSPFQGIALTTGVPLGVTR